MFWRQRYCGQNLLAPELPAFGLALLSGNEPSESLAGWPEDICPNFSDWLPGDIVLIRSTGQGQDAIIEQGQRFSFNRATRDGSMYVHAAIYAGNGEIVDITRPLGIAKRSLWAYCQSNAVAVRRMRSLTMQQHQDIADHAQKLLPLGLDYSLAQLVLSKIIPKQAPNKDSLYCSTLVGLAVEKGCGKNLAGPWIYRPLHPGTLAEHQDLDPVQLEWRPRV